MDGQHKGKGDMGEGQHDLIDTLRTFVMQIVSIIIIQFFFFQFTLLCLFCLLLL